MSVTKLPEIKYPPATACIYCDATAYSPTRSKRSDEHVVPYCLGGTLVLPEASCESCQKETSRVEREIGRKTYRALRALNGYPTRRPKDTPRTVPVEFEYKGGTIESVAIPIEDVPVSVVVPRFRLPPFAASAQGFPDGLRTTMRALPVKDPPTKQALDALQRRYRRHALRTIVTTGEIRPFGFGRLLYKISLGLLAIERPDALRSSPLRAKIPDAARYVMDDVFSAPAAQLTTGLFRARLFTAVDGEHTSLFSGIRLFGALDDTEYFCRVLAGLDWSLAVHFDESGRVPGALKEAGEP